MKYKFVKNNQGVWLGYRYELGFNKQFVTVTTRVKIGEKAIFNQGIQATECHTKLITKCDCIAELEEVVKSITVEKAVDLTNPNNLKVSERILERL